MNEKGLSLFRLIGIIVVIGAVLTIVFPGVSNFLGNGKLATFISYEDDMEDAAIQAVRNCVASGSFDCVNPSKGEHKDIKLSYLINKGYIKDINAPNGESCDYDKSHVHVIGNGNLNFDYKVCLVCGSYQTKDEMCQ